MPLMAAALVGALALAALALSSTVIVAVLLLALVGGARTVQAIAAQTLLQRSTPLEVVVCAFSLVESLRDAGLALGALLVPLLIGLGGADAAFVGLAAFVPAVVLVTARRIRRIDSEATIPVVEIGVLRKLPIFSALPAASLETLAREARYATFARGTAIITEGEEGDSYHVITHGAVEVTKDGREIRQMGVGEGFGEIALLHAVARTATVRATDETTVLSVGREPFLTAMQAQPVEPRGRHANRRRDGRAARAEAAGLTICSKHQDRSGAVVREGGSRCPSSPICSSGRCERSATRSSRRSRARRTRTASSPGGQPTSAPIRRCCWRSTRCHPNRPRGCCSCSTCSPPRASTTPASSRASSFSPTSRSPRWKPPAASPRSSA